MGKNDLVILGFGVLAVYLAQQRGSFDSQTNGYANLADLPYTPTPNSSPSVTIINQLPKDTAVITSPVIKGFSKPYYATAKAYSSAKISENLQKERIQSLYKSPTRVNANALTVEKLGLKRTITNIALPYRASIISSWGI